MTTELNEFDRAYNELFRGRAVNTQHLNDCEKIWRRALTTSQPAQAGERTGYSAPKGRYVPPVLFNPYSGEPRDARDIHSDPHGVLIVPPGADLVASLPAQPAQATHGPRSLREAREDAQRARMMARAAGRTPSAATADFDLPAPNDDTQQATPTLDTDMLRDMLQRIEGRYRAAMGTAYCQGSEAHRAQLRAARESVAAAEAYLDAVDAFGKSTTHQATPEPVGEPFAWTSMGQIRFTPPTQDHDTYTALYTRPAPGVPDVEAAAKKLAECMDYPWEHMPSAGRDNMRKHAEAVLAAAQAKGADHV